MHVSIATSNMQKKNKDVILFSSELCKAPIDVQGATY